MTLFKVRSIGGGMRSLSAINFASVTMLIQRSGVILYSMSRWIHVLLDKRRSWVWVRDRHWSRCKATEARLWFTQRQLTQFQWTCCTSYSAAGQL